MTETDTQHKVYTYSEISDVKSGRTNLGGMMPVEVYRLFQYSLRNTLTELYGKDMMIETFRAAGEAAGREFAEAYLNMELELDDFMTELQQKLESLKIGMLKIESFDISTGHAVLTVAEDLDCSGLPETGETVCNYDEGFIAGILKEYTNKNYVVTEVDCWAKGDSICRFDAVISDKDILDV